MVRHVCIKVSYLWEKSMFIKHGNLLQFHFPTFEMPKPEKKLPKYANLLLSAKIDEFTCKILLGKTSV